VKHKIYIHIYLKPPRPCYFNLFILGIPAVFLKYDPILCLDGLFEVDSVD